MVVNGMRIINHHHHHHHCTVNNPILLSWHEWSQSSQKCPGCQGPRCPTRSTIPTQDSTRFIVLSYTWISWIQWITWFHTLYLNSVVSDQWISSWIMGFPHIQKKPKSSIWKGMFSINHPFLGYPHDYGNPHMSLFQSAKNDINSSIRAPLQRLLVGLG